MKPKVIVSVSNDLVSDQRVHKSCMSLVNSGWEVLLVGRKLPNSLPLQKRDYQTKRLALIFKSGPLFYAEMNLRFFLFLLFKSCKVLHSNDLDTLPSNYLAAKIKGKHLVYDSHEYYTEVPELVSRPKVQGIWKFLEKLMVPNLKHMFTVNDSIANLFKKKYGITAKVMRNMPLLEIANNNSGASSDEKIILLQGAGINIQRGAEELVEAMQYVNKGVLMIVGSGDVVPYLKELSKKLQLENRIIFKDKMPFEQLKSITQKAYIGCSLDKATNINYEFSLPNKLFDYIHSGVPVLATNLTEIAKIVQQYQVGIIIPSHQPKDIANCINEILEDEKQHQVFKENCAKAATELHWENEEKGLISTYNSFLEK